MLVKDKNKQFNSEFLSATSGTTTKHASGNAVIVGKRCSHSVFFLFEEVFAAMSWNG